MAKWNCQNPACRKEFEASSYRRYCDSECRAAMRKSERYSMTRRYPRLPSPPPPKEGARPNWCWWKTKVLP